MQPDTDRIGELFVKFLKDELSGKEYQELDYWLRSSRTNRRIFDRLCNSDYLRQQLQILQNVDKEHAWGKISKASLQSDVLKMPVSAPARPKWYGFFIAAAIAGVIVVGNWLLVKYHINIRAEATKKEKSKFGSDALPGGDKALLTLADGSVISLDKAHTGMIARQGNAKIKKLENGRLSYEGASDRPAVITYNTLTTPRAGQFQVVLPDGTAVWLNNASSLRYPTAFGATREVALQGEAYFEVSPDTRRPFTVKVGDQSIDVLGTNFNITAYADEVQATTVLSGAVSVTRDQAKIVLKTGEQAQSSGAGELRILKDVDVQGVVAWKNGFFHFERSDLRSVMRTLARWYDVNVVYDGPVTGRMFGGDIQRNLNLSQVLDILDRNGVHFRIEDKKIIVRP